MPVITTIHPYSECASCLLNGTYASGAWPAANRAIFIPFRLPKAQTVVQLASLNGTAVSGNVDMGIYTMGGSKVVSIGTTVQTGTSTIQIYDIADTLLAPGYYMLALALDNTTGTFFRFVPSAQWATTMGVQQMASAFVLPSSVTYATPVSAYVPMVYAIFANTF